MAKSLGAIEAGAAVVRVSLDNKEFRKGLHASTRLMRQYGAMLSKIGAMGVGAGGALIGSFAVLTNQVAKLETQFKRFDLIFSDMASSMRRELSAITRETGVPMSTLVREASTFGAVFNEMREDISDPQFVKVIGNTMRAMLDLAAVAGISLEEAAERLKSGFTSTGESVDQFGFNLRKANLQAEAMRLGFNRSIMTMSEQEKQLIKLSIFMRQADRTGISFVNMVDTINGQLTLMRSNLVELVYRAGWAIRAGVTPLLRSVNKLLIALRPVATMLSPVFVALGALGTVLGGAGAAILGVGLLLQLLSFSLGGFAKFGMDLSTLSVLLTSLPALAAKARTAIFGLATAFAALNANVLGVLRSWPLLLAALKYPLAMLGRLLAIPGLAIGAGALALHQGVKYGQNQGWFQTYRGDDYLKQRFAHLQGTPGQTPIAGLIDLLRGTRGRYYRGLQTAQPTPEVAQVAANAAAASSIAGAFGGNIARRLGYGPSVSAQDQTNSILSAIAEKVTGVVDGDKVNVALGVN